MRVFIERTEEECASAAKDVSSWLVELGVNPETVLVVKNGVLVTMDAELSAEDEVRVISVISGG